MKKFLIILLASGLMFGCEEQAATEGSSTTTQPVNGEVPTQPQIPYSRTVIGLTSLPLLSDTSYWNLSKNGSPNTIAGNDYVDYVSVGFTDQVYVTSKFKIMGDINNNGAFSLSADLSFSANSNQLLAAVGLNFGNTPTDAGKIQVALTAMNANTLVYRLSVAYNGGPSNDVVFNATLASNATTQIIPITFSRSSSGVLSVNVNGNIHNFSQASFSEDVDFYGYASGQGTASVQNLTLSSNTTFTQFSGRQ